MNCTTIVSCSTPDLWLCQEEQCVSMSSLYIAALVLCATGTIEACIMIRRGCKYIGGWPSTFIHEPGLTESIICGITYVMGSFTIVIVLLIMSFTHRFSSRESYTEKTHLWFGIGVARWTIALGLWAYRTWHIRKMLIDV
jgi:hypothetical protein